VQGKSGLLGRACQGRKARQCTERQAPRRGKAGVLEGQGKSGQGRVPKKGRAKQGAWAGQSKAGRLGRVGQCRAPMHGKARKAPRHGKAWHLGKSRQGS
jgi:hypothetical protein